MNIPCANDDEDFPVFKAGPPLPVRSKTKPNCKIKSIPLKATKSIPSKSSSKGTSMSQSHNSIISNTNAALNPTITAESKVKQYIERVKANDEQGRKTRIKPEQMLSLEELYQVNNISESKCEHSVNSVNSDNGKNKDKKISATDVENKLRETMRIVKEKDELINKLRESCHDLAIKCADAENRVDEIRFSYGRSSSSACAEKGSVSLKKSCDDDHQHQHLPLFSELASRRCISAEGLNKCGISSGEDVVAQSREMDSSVKIDKATETVYEVVKYDAHTQVNAKICPNDCSGTQKLLGSELCQLEDDILQETCSNWMEKVQNWKTDSNFNLSQDSGGDKDSGFRGSSAEIDAESILKNRHPSIILKAQRKYQGYGEKLLKVPQMTKTIAQQPQISPSTTTTITASGSCHNNHENQGIDHPPTQQHFWPSFNSSSQSSIHLNQLHSGNFSGDSTKAKSLFYELAEAERNKYACFQEGYSSKYRLENRLQRMGGAKSLDILYMPSSSHHTTEELKSLIDSSFDPPELILKSHMMSQHRSIDNKVKMLGPLLDDTTQLALRVKMKSERLSKMLNDACALERRNSQF